MSIKEISLSWIVVEDLKKAVKFYTDVVGLKLNEMHEQHGWAELSGHEGGSRLGIAQKNDRERIQPGQNAVVTLTVENLTKSMADLSKKGAKTLGDVVEVPGMVKLQMIVDNDGNHLQLVEMLSTR